ncbi:MAG TPA: protein kinase [Pseudomonadota bacterium]|nr:protein kinase [Pseudomonadota bacterium]HNI60396.1 protein kinase [Pseudomonadota bacterium]HNO67467.1 protein kinase [Pseudomonadota bacterium]
MALPYGKYLLDRKLAEGGMAEIFLARPAPGQGGQGVRPGPFVVKRLFAHQSADTEFVRMFKNEARLAALLKHPNIVDIFDQGEIDGSFFLAMEFINGEDLRSIAQQSDTMNRRPPLPVVGRIIMDMLAGLHYAHSLADENGKPLGVVHRDVSPQNILVTYDGQVKIIDFGIAKATMAAESEQTQAGMVKGKYAYMSPEQARSAKLDGRSDVFSVGILLWELITWRRLFKRGTDLATMVAVAEEPAPSMLLLTPDCPQALDDVVQKALAKDTEQRYRSAQEFAAALGDCMTKLGWDFAPKAVGAYMSEIFRERVAQRESELRAVMNAAKRDSLRQAVPAIQLPPSQPTPKAPSVTMPLQVINLQQGPGGRPVVPANLRTTMPFGPSGLQAARPGARPAAPAGLTPPSAKEASSDVLALRKNPSPAASPVAPSSNEPDTVPMRKATPPGGTPPVAGPTAAPGAKRSPADGIKVDAATNASLATVPTPALNRSRSKENLPAHRQRVILAIALGVSIGVLAVIVLQLLLR